MTDPYPFRLALLSLLLPALVHAQSDTTKAAPADTVPKLVFTRYVDAYYAYYTDSVGDGNYQKFPTVSPRSEFGLNVAMIGAQYDAEKVRGAIALQYGDIPKSAWGTTFNNILEAHVGFRLCTKLWFDAGLFRTHFGTEGLYPKENIASSIAVGTWHEPYFESGARLVYTPNDKWAFNLYVLNGYNLYVDNNAKKSLGLLATYALGDKGNIGYSNYIGDDTPTEADSISHLRIHNNLFLNYGIKKLKIQLGGDYCIQEHSDLSDPDASAMMFSGQLALKYQCNERFAVYAREEWMNDPEGYMGGVFTDKNGELTGLILTGTTAGVEIKPTADTYVRLEGRQLMADGDQEIFHWDNENTNSRAEVMLNMGITFYGPRRFTKPTNLMFDTGITGFMLLATSLVMLMTPGLAFFYGGLAGKRNILGIMIQSFVSMGITTILWFVCGYSLCFSGDAMGGLIGNLDKAFMQGVDLNTPFPGNNKLPEFVFMAYQMMFAIITPALITGAFVNRVTFKSYLVFLVLWQLLVYYPFAHMVWGGGLLAQWGVLDFAGGIVVHATAGFAALASVFYVGKRRDKASPPNSVPLIAIGTGLLWFGWYGFNAGSALDVNAVTGLAFLNTDVAASFAAITWLVIEWSAQRKPKFVGLLTGAVAGLATITPAAGYVSLPSAVIIGIAAGVICYIAVNMKNKMGWDDALDVWGVHGIGGCLGVILLGVFASKAMNGAGADGLMSGGTHFFLVQTGAVIGACIYAFVFTYVMLAVINKLTPVRVSEVHEDQGLDEALHGEKAYDEGVL